MILRYPIFEQPICLITSLGHPLVNRKSINLNETLKYNQISFSKNADLYYEIQRLFSLCGGTSRISYSVEEDEAVSGLVVAGFGIAVVSKMRILKTLLISIIPINFPKFHRFMYMAVLKKHYQSSASQKLIDFISKNVSMRL